jgi:hypothetical protein
LESDPATTVAASVVGSEEREGIVDFDSQDEENLREVLCCLLPRAVVVVRTSTKFSDASSPANAPSQALSSKTTQSSEVVAVAGAAAAGAADGVVGVVDLDKIEQWYGVKYGDGPCPPRLSAYWEGEGETVDTPWASALALPSPNKYIPDNLTLVSTEAELAQAAEKKIKFMALRGAADTSSPPSGQQPTADGRDNQVVLEGVGESGSASLKALAEEGDGVCSCGLLEGDDVQLSRNDAFAAAMAMHASGVAAAAAVASSSSPAGNSSSDSSASDALAAQV